MSTPVWVEQVKRSGLPAAMSAVGMTARGRGWGPCPACNADHRGSDPRPPVGTSAAGGWQCHSCGVSGDAADLLACRVVGRRLSECSSDERDLVRDQAARMGLADDHRPDDPRAARRPRSMPSSRPGAAPATVRGVDRGGGARPAAVDATGPESGPGDGSPARASGRPPPWTDDLCERATFTLWADPAAQAVRDYLTAGPGGGPGGSDGRRLPEETCRAWKLGAILWGDWWWVVIPILDPRTGDAVNAKLCRVPDATGARPKPKYTSCSGRPLTLFGQRSLTNDLSAPVVVVEGELDVLALWAYGYQGSVVSGTSGAGSFDDAWLDALEPYEQFVLAYDVEASGIGDDGAASLADRLGKYRCARASMPRKDASECWLHGVPEPEIRSAIDRAKPYAGMESSRIDTFADEIEAAIRDPSRLMGRPTGSPRLDSLIAGWGDGVYVLTGPTKAGKSTLAIWALREQARMGVPAALTSFENGRGPAVQKLLRMQLGGDFLQRTEADRRGAMADLGRMPLHVIGHYGQAKLEDMVATIRYHRRRHGVQVMLIDHIGFLVDLSRREDETRQLQHAMRTLVTTANDERMCVILIAHPDKTAEKEGRRVRIFDIRGTSSIQQDCAAGLSLSWDASVKDANDAPIPNVRIHVDALRKEWGAGTGSSGVLYFDPDAQLYADERRMLPCGRLVHP